MGSQIRSAIILTGLWVLVVAVALVVRPPLPVDETRYLAVAWDMWLEGHYLVPYLNGEPYSHKPPLLFWLMTAGWHAFGVNEWWPRLVAPLFGLGSMLFTMRLARVLWPDRPEVPGLAPLLLFACSFWALFTTLTMFDMMLAFFALAALIALVMAARTGRWRGFLAAGIAIGLGVLAKGPAILLHYLPVALTAPWWLPALAGEAAKPRWGRWYGGVALSVVVAATVGLAWAVPAGISGGEAYRNAIFWGQSAGRVVDSFAHARPFWWYAAVIPGLVLPLLVWPPLWRAFARLGRAFGDGGVRLTLVWMGAAFVVFSLVSGKQLHYLLPEFPALALLAAYLMSRSDAASGAQVRRRDLALPGILLLVAGAALIALPHLEVGGRLGQMAGEGRFGLAGLLVIFAAGVMRLAAADRVGQAGRLALAVAVLVCAVHVAFSSVLYARYDLTPIAREIKAYEDAGKRVANVGKYHGQYHYLGRLTKPVPAIGLVDGDMQAYFAAHPDGYAVAYYKNLPKTPEPLSTFRFRNLTAVFWPVAVLKAHPGLEDRQ